MSRHCIRTKSNCSRCQRYLMMWIRLNIQTCVITSTVWAVTLISEWIHWPTNSRCEQYAYIQFTCFLNYEYYSLINAIFLIIHIIVNFVYYYVICKFTVINVRPVINTTRMLVTITGSTQNNLYSDINVYIFIQM